MNSGLNPYVVRDDVAWHDSIGTPLCEMYLPSLAEVEAGACLAVLSPVCKYTPHAPTAPPAVSNHQES